MADINVSIVKGRGQSTIMATTGGLSISGGRLRNSQGQIVTLRGVNTEGVANFRAFFPGGINSYIDRIVGLDSTATLWQPNVVRLNFERYPCCDPTRLYQSGDARIPYCIPDTSQFPAWPANTSVLEGSVYSYGGIRYAASKRKWRHDKGAAWNIHDNPTYVVGDVLCGIWSGAEGDASANRVYVCTVAQTAYVPGADISQGPHGTGTITCSVGATWQYLGEWGTTGSSQPFGGTRKFDGNHITGIIYFDGWIDNLASWSPIGPDLSPEDAEDAWDNFTSTVLNPTVQRCIDRGLYCFICDFDFGPADLPLRNARMMEFWDRVSNGPWKNHPMVMFDLWNESLDVGGFSGWTWTNQKPYVQAAVDMIRANGASNVVLVTTPAFCAYTDLATASPLTGANIMYASHLYSDFDNLSHLSTALASGQAVFVSEFGSNQVDDTTVTDTFLTNLMAACESSRGSSHPAAGWMAWAFTRYWAPGFFSNDAYTTPNYYGGEIRDLFTELN